MEDDDDCLEVLPNPTPPHHATLASSYSHVCVRVTGARGTFFRRGATIFSARRRFDVGQDGAAGFDELFNRLRLLGGKGMGKRHHQHLELSVL